MPTPSHSSRPWRAAPIAGWCLALALPVAAQDQISARVDDGSTLIHDPAMTWSEGNYHVLHNGVDTVVAGVGAGLGSFAGVDGVGTWIPGQQLVGNHKTSLGDFGYRQVGFRETVQVIGPPGPATIELPYIAWIEFDGGNAHQPAVFTNVVDPDCGNVAPYGSQTMPYGSPTAEPSFLTVSSGSGHDLMIPNEDILSGPGTATIIAELHDIVLPIPDTGGVWEVQIEWVTPLESRDDIDGWYHWATSSPNDDQLFALSDDELNLWHSHTVATSFGLLGPMLLPANMEYGLMMLSGDPVTQAALAPVGAHGAGPYYGLPTTGPNTGFDLGMGSTMASASGVQGVIGPTSFANQDPAGAALPGAVPSLGFVTFDNTDYDADGDLVGTPPQGTQRIVWIDLDYDLMFGVAPELATELLFYLGCVRMPLRIPSSVPSPFPQPLTLTFLPLWTHATAPTAWPDPGGFGVTPGEFGIPMVAGQTAHIPLSTLPPLCIGLPLGMTYGSSGLSGGALTWDPSVSRVSGSRQLFLVD